MANSPCLTALVLLAGSCATLAAGPVIGVIRYASGGAAPDVTIQLLNSEQAVIASAKADSQGRFQLAGVNPGDYVLPGGASGAKWSGGCHCKSAIRQAPSK